MYIYIAYTPKCIIQYIILNIIYYKLWSPIFFRMCSRPQHSAEAGTVCGEQLMTWTNAEQWNQGQESVWLPVVQTSKSRVSVQLGWGEVWFRDGSMVDHT